MIWISSIFCHLHRKLITQNSKYPWIKLSISLLLTLDLYDCLNVRPQKEKYTPDYHFYHNLSQIENELIKIVEKYPNYIKIDWDYKSRHKRSQLLLHLSNFTGSNLNQISSSYRNMPKVRVLLSYGEHAREFLPIESMFFLLKNITEGLSSSPNSHSAIFTRNILTKMDLYVIAMANPDGRIHIEKTENYCWRGTGNGVDLDRNFDWEFGNKGSSSDPNDEEYRGTEALSEPECRVFTDLTGRIRFDAFISFHSGIQHIYIPFSDSESKKIGRKPNNIDDMLRLAAMLSRSTSAKFMYGQAYQLNGYTADGTIFDYMSGVRGIPFSYTVELWGKEHKGLSCFDLFNPKNEDLQDVVKSLHPFYVKLFTYLIDWKAENYQHLHDQSRDVPSLSFGFVLLVVVIIITIVVMAVHGKIPFCKQFNQRKRVISLKFNY